MKIIIIKTTLWKRLKIKQGEILNVRYKGKIFQHKTVGLAYKFNSETIRESYEVLRR